HPGRSRLKPATSRGDDNLDGRACTSGATAGAGGAPPGPSTPVPAFVVPPPRPSPAGPRGCRQGCSPSPIPPRDSSPFPAPGGAGCLALAGYFLVRDLDLPPETLLSAAALLAAIAAVLRQPRRVPWIAPAALLALAVFGGGWFLADTSPALLPALALTAFASI